jgi:hypothetical protein
MQKLFKTNHNILIVDSGGWKKQFLKIRYPLIYALNQKHNLPIYLGNNWAWSRRTNNAFKIKFKMVQKRSLNSISLILNIIYYLERQALYDNFFLYPVVIESSLIYVGAWSTLSNIFFLMNKNHSFLGRKKFRSAPSFNFICLPEIPRQPPCIWSGSRQLCLFGGGRSF